MNLPLFSLSLLKWHWKLIVGALLLAALGVQTLRVAGLKSSLTAEKAGRTADRLSYEKAQAEATANALSNKLKVETENAKKADVADSRADDLAARYRALSLQYASAQRAAGKADLPSPAQGAESSDGPGRPSLVPQGSILIPQADALICATNTARLEAVREWALSLSQP